MSDGRDRVWRRNGERFAECCVKQRDRWGGGSVLVWGGITADNRTQLHVLDRSIKAHTYRDQILAPIVQPFMRRHLPNGVFQHDNARPHIARLCTQYLQTNNIEVLGWPSLSPDLSPIEHLWDELGRRVYLRDPPPTNVNELRTALLQERQRISQGTIRTLIRSMRRRCNEVIQAHGGHTRY